MNKIKVVGYLSGIPLGVKNQHKRDIILRFIEGINKTGDVGIVHNTKGTVPADIAFIQGWVHAGSGDSAHLNIRKQVIQQQKTLSKHTLVVDSNLFNYADPDNKDRYLRYSFDGVFPTTGNYFSSKVDPARWQQISKDQNITLKDWRTSGNHILICTQRPGGWSMGGLDVNQWLNYTITELRKYTNRPIVVRSHPGAKGSKESVSVNNRQGLYTVSSNKFITDDLKNAHAVITFNSSPGVAAAIEGVPVFVTDPNPRMSQAYEVSNHSLTLIENPRMPERQQWIEKLAMCHWNNEEARSGAAWQHIKQFIANAV